MNYQIEYFKPKLLITQNCGIHSISSELYNHSSIVLEALKLSNFKIDNIIINNRNDIEYDSSIQHIYQNNFENSNDWDVLIKGLESLIEYEIVNSNDPIFITFTSGTTGNPKGLLFSSGEFAVVNSYLVKILYNFQPGNIIFSTIILSVKNSHSIIYGSFKYCSTVLLIEGNTSLPNANTMFEVCSKHNVKTMMVFPKRIKNIQSIDNNGETISKLNLSCLKNIFLMGEKYDESVITYLKKSIGNKCIISNVYGQSETTAIACDTIPLPFKPNSIGFILPGKNVEYLSKSGEKLNAYERGELVIKLPLQPGSVYSFFKDNETDSFLNESYFSKYPGYYNGGDVGYFDNENKHYVLSRVNDIAIINGHDIFVGEYDDIIISTNSMILDSVVVGVNEKTSSTKTSTNGNSNNERQILVGFILFKPEFQQLISSNPNNLLNSIQNEINNKPIESIGGECAKLQYLIPITKIPTTFNNKKIKHIFSKLYNGQNQIIIILMILINLNLKFSFYLNKSILFKKKQWVWLINLNLKLINLKKTILKTFKIFLCK